MNAILLLFLSLYLFGILFPLHNLFLIFFITFYTYYSFKLIRINSILIPKLIVLAILFQNTFLGIGMHLFGIKGESITLYTQVPTILIFIPAMIILLNEFSKKEYLLFYLFVCLVGLNFIISPIKNISIFAYNVRNFTVFYLSYIVGKKIIDTRKKVDELAVFYIRCVILAGVVGLFGVLTNGKLYEIMGATEVANIKTMNSSYYKFTGLPGFFMGDFFGTYYLRMASLFLEPVNFSSFVSLAVILQTIYLRKAIDWMKLLFLLLTNFLTFGKGGLLISGICMFGLILKYILYNQMRFSRKTTRQTVITGLLFLILIFGVFYGTHYSYNLHFYAIKITLQALIKQPWGFGVGSVGNMSNFFSAKSLIGAETGLLNFACQLGIEGAVVFIVLLGRMSQDAYKGFRNGGGNDFFIFSLLPIVLMAVFMFQENTFTTQVITGFMLFQGYYSNAYKKTIPSTFSLQNGIINDHIMRKSVYVR